MSECSECEGKSGHYLTMHGRSCPSCGGTDEREARMDYPKPVYGKGSVYDLEPPGKTWFVVQHNDNSDHGRVWQFFEYEDEARAYCDGIEADPPKGNHRHPAPGTLNIMLFSMQRLHRFPEVGADG